MPADPQVVETGKVFSSAVLKTLIPWIAIAGIIGVTVAYFISRFEKGVLRIFERQKRKRRIAQANQMSTEQKQKRG